jgi:hypothetical protein
MGPNTYPGGTIFGLGRANPVEDLWFREGIVVPEPSAAQMIFLAGVGVAGLRRIRGR